MTERIPPALQARIDRVGTIQSLSHVEHKRHPITGRYELSGITCKVCKTLIAGPVDSGFHNRTEMLGSKEIIYRTMMFSRYSLYTEIDMEFDDGSHHVTHLCKQCISRVGEEGMLEKLYVADLAQWVHEDLQGIHQTIWDGLTSIIERKPTGHWKDLGGV